jgi:radical SAM superfamily enzyme with C-terminal helix-hairpin-helix motif
MKVSHIVTYPKQARAIARMVLLWMKQHGVVRITVETLDEQESTEDTQ